MSKDEQKLPVNLNLDIGEDEQLTQDESIAKISMILAETKDEKILSELDDFEIKLCSALFAVAEQTNDKMVESFLKAFLRLRVSNKRLGRREILELAKAANTQGEGRMNRLKQMLGIGQRY